MINDSKPRSSGWTADTKIEALNLWRKAIQYSNSISRITQYFAEDDPHQLEHKVQKSALKVVNHIARGSKRKGQTDIQNSLTEAMDSLHDTVSKLVVANHQKLVRRDIYFQAYHEGRLLAKKLKDFQLTVFTTDSKN